MLDSAQRGTEGATLPAATQESPPYAFNLPASRIASSQTSDAGLRIKSGNFCITYSRARGSFLASSKICFTVSRWTVWTSFSCSTRVRMSGEESVWAYDPLRVANAKTITIRPYHRDARIVSLIANFHPWRRNAWGRVVVRAQSLCFPIISRASQRE